MRSSVISLALLAALAAPSQAQDLKADLGNQIHQLMPKVIDWRRDIHQHPELSNSEVRTSQLVAAHLKKLGLEVRTGIAHHGVVGILKGGKPGPVVALRADMDALPVAEKTGLPYASKVKALFAGEEVGVMHACGHDAHTAMLMGAAEALAKLRKDIPGTVIFLFQPAEEGAPPGEEGGAALMLKEGVFKDPKPDAIFGLHVWPMEAGKIFVRPEGTMAASDRFEVTIKGQQTHGSSPWRGVDPVTVAGSMIEAIELLPSRQVDVTKAPVVVSIGQVKGGIRFNIIPDEVKLVGTIRTFDEQMRSDLIERMERTVKHVAEASGASATLEVSSGAAVTWNDAKLTDWAGQSLAWAAGDKGVGSLKPITGAEDFSYFQQQVPGVFFFLGVAPEGKPLADVAPNHSPYFVVNESALENGVRALSGLALDYLSKGSGQ
ncbi:amidohydrolase [Gallaecimonas xiamenensis]|uniref:Hydrolase n=1 Tax=Gallaecimonas xiamenensis 3-C-1 TaxID=745411 RepID=K2J326_9GAMM|nr:amidohydrolase [Gallaecimonas xiamenensis]EKE77421.1 hydrolase [Gallaecimonas xiamenensis 3-C-1]